MFTSLCSSAPDGKRWTASNLILSRRGIAQKSVAIKEVQRNERASVYVA
jgi:hypothetical protein